MGGAYLEKSFCLEKYLGKDILLLEKSMYKVTFFQLLGEEPLG